jgi:uncharacterized pyridoxal phosphate-dependent enzyme
MESATATTIYEQIGVKPVINARGFNTVVGGNTPTPRMKAAMEQVERYYVDMNDLLERTGEIAARLMGAEAAYITPGCAAALALGTAACIAGDDLDKISRLPDTTGLKNETVIQKGHVYQYDRAACIVGTRLIEVGDANGTTAEQLDAALGPRTANVLFAAHLDRVPGTLPLERVLEIAHGKGVPVLVDAAAQVFPLDRFTGFARSGADLVAYSTKYFGGPNSAGLLVGRKDLVRAASMQGFIGFETVSQRKAFGRPFKMDRQEIVCALVAIQEWLGMDHDRRLAEVERRIAHITRAVEGLPGVSTELLRRAGASPRVLRVSVDPAVARRSAGEVFEELRNGNPSIWVNREPNALLVNPEPLKPNEVDVVASRLRALLA